MDVLKIHNQNFAYFQFSGLFNAGHMAYESDRNKGPDGEPSIARMARKAIEVLRKNPRGYFLMVEGKRLYAYLKCV